MASWIVRGSKILLQKHLYQKVIKIDLNLQYQEILYCTQEGTGEKAEVKVNISKEVVLSGRL